MFVEKYHQMGTGKSRIRVLFEYGMAQAKIVGQENVFDFSIGNPSVPAPQAVADTVRELLEMDPIALHGYTPAGGCAEARESIAADLSRRSGDKIRPENIFFTCGAAPAMTSAMHALAVENAEFILIAPYFSEYPAYAASTGAKCVVVPPDTEHFQIRFDELEKRINRNTQAVIINSPNNPSGVIYLEDTFRKLAELLNRKGEEIGHPIYVLSDEPYRELTYDGLDSPYVPKYYPNTVICYSFSKSLSMPGERIGYVCVPDCCADSAALYAAIAGAARALGHVCAPSLWQRVVARNIDLRPDLLTYDHNRMTLYTELSRMGFRCVKPQGAFYMMVEAPDGDSEGFSDRAKALNILTVPCDGFGCPGFSRFSTCVSPAMIQRSLPAFRKLAESYSLKGE
ncbi:MAG: pyridoxal phosphate-dependent aminotransferase [Oscillospiraceae bacterium]|nr:pyridoxal phosphate-dependent aminotransferase [Oscillospiraceae bacterium]